MILNMTDSDITPPAHRSWRARRTRTAQGRGGAGADGLQVQPPASHRARAQPHGAR